MISLKVISKRGGGANAVSANEILLKEASVIRIGLSKEQVKGMRRVGNDLVITAVSGEVITIREFFVSFEGNRNDLVLGDDKGGLWLAEFGAGEGDMAVSYSGIDSIEPLLMHQDFNFGVLPWLIGGGLAAAGAASGGGGGGDGGGASLPVFPLAAPSDTTAPARPTVNPTNAVSITGTAEPGATVRVMDSAGKEIGSATAAPDGSYVVRPVTPPPHGSELRVVAADRAGNVSPEAQVTVDSVPPRAPTVAPTDGSPITGTAEPGSVVTVSDGRGNLIGSTTAGPDGVYGITLATPPADGTVIRVVATDAAGNASQPATTTVDSTAPVGPTINPTDGSRITGTAEPGSVVTVTDAKGTVIGSTTAAANGVYSFTPAKQPANGEVIRAVAADAAGNVSPPATTTIDGTPPTPTIRPTNGSQVAGTSEPGSVVTITDGKGGVIGSMVTAANGTYSLTPAKPLADGTVIEVLARDPAGNVGKPVTTTVDGRPPADPTVKPTSGSLITGTAEAGSVVTIRDDTNKIIGSTVAAPGDTYSFAPGTLPLNGTELRVTATDAAGNVSGIGKGMVDSVAPVIAVAIVNDADKDGFINAAEKGAGVTVKVTLVSGAAIGDVVQLADGTTTSTVTLTAADVAKGFVDVPFASPAEGGAIQISATSRDLAGNVSRPVTSNRAVLDTTPPATPATATATDNVDPVRGPIAGGGTTDDTVPTLTGSGAKPGELVRFYDDGNLIGSTTVGADGSWSFEPAALGQGRHSIAHTVTDAAGNTSAASTPIEFTVDNGAVSVSVELVGRTGRQTPPTGFTNDTAPVLEGKTAPGVVVTVTDGAAVLGSATADVGGKWRLALAQQSEGAHNYKAVAVNAAGKKSEASLALTIDTTPPAAPAIAITDDVGALRGPLTSGSFTDDTRPTLSGSGAKAGDRIRIHDNGTVVGSTTVEADGSWKFDFSSVIPPLKDGEHRFTATAIDPVGNESAHSTSFTLTVDTIAPAAPAAATGYVDDAGTLKGPATSTNDTMPGLKVGQLAAGLTPTLYVDGVRAAGATYDPATGTLTPGTPLPEGEHKLSYTLSDAAGNESPRSGDLMLTVDTTPPPALDANLIQVLDNEGAVNGRLSAGAQTDDSKPEYIGKADPNQVSSVNVYDKGVLIGNAEVKADGSWRFEPSQPVAEGEHRFTARPVDAAGNVGAATPESTFTLVGAAPPAPAITGVRDDKGNLAKDASTNDTTLTLGGTGKAGTVVTVYANDVAVGSASVASNDTWSVTTGVLSGDGLKNLRAVAVDGAGQSSPSTGLYPVVLDTTAPAKPGVVVAEDNQGTQGTIAAGGTTDDALPAFSGSGAKAGDTVKVYDGSTLVGSVTLASDGAWRLTPGKPLGEGAHSIKYTITDAAGNTSVASETLDFTVDTSKVVVGIDHAEDNRGDIKRDLVSGARTDDTTPTLVGKTTPGAVVTITDGANGPVLGATRADAGGNWRFELPAQGEGTHKYEATAVNAAGTTGTAVIELTIDTTAPAVPGIALVGDDVGLVQAPLVSGGSTDDTTPTLAGSGATAGDVIRIYDKGSFLDSTTVRADGSWSFTPNPPLAEGEHRLSATATDAVGNESAHSDVFTINVDVTAPTAKATLGAISDDTGTSNGDFITSDTTLVVTAKVSAVIGADEKVQISLDNGRTWNDATPVGGGNYQFDNKSASLADGSHTFLARVVDAAGNAGQASSQVVVIDTGSPTSGNAVAITAYTDGVQPNVGDYAGGSSTNDTTPTLKGTVSGLKAGDVVQVLEGSVVLGTAIVNGGAWEFTLPAVTSDGTRTYTAAIVNAAGNKGTTSAGFTLTVDTTAPAAPATVPTSYDDNAGDIRDPKSTAASTDDTRPGINIGQVATGLTPTLYVDGVKVAGAAYDPATGTLTADTPLAEGDHRLSYTLTDQAGNESPRSGELRINVDTTPPPALDASLIQVQDDVGAVKAVLSAGAQTDDSKPEYTGKADPNQVSSVNVYDKGVLIGNADVKADGTWRFEPTLPLAQGDHSFTARPVDAAGNLGTVTPASTFTLLGDVPPAPAITGVSDDKGSLAKDAGTNDTTLTLSGTGQSGTLVIVRANGADVGSTSVAANGTWSLTTSALSGDGVKNLSAIAKDGAGRSSPETGLYPIVLDTTPPSTPGVIAAGDDQGLAQGPITAGSTTDDASPTFSGSGLKAGDTVNVYDGSTLIGSFKAPTDGAWSVTPGKPLGEGAHSIRHTITDAAGNTSAASAPLDFTVDTSRVIVGIGHAEDNRGDIKRDLVSGARTDDTTPTLVGKATAGAVVTVKDGANGPVLGSTTADAGGNWRFELPAQAEGAHKYEATAVNAAGTTGMAVIELTIDTTAPAVPGIASVGDDVGLVQAPLANNGFTDDTTPTLAGSGATAGDVIKVYDNGGAIGSTTVKADGSWSFTPTTPLTEGAHRLTATAIDAVGNESAQSGSFTVNVDVTAPTTKATLGAISDDTGTSSSDFVTSDRTLVATVTVDTAMEPGARVEISLDNGRTWNTAAPVGGGNYQFDNRSVPLAEGSHTFLARVVDAAGNATQPTSQVVIVDGSGPFSGNAIDITAYNDDVAPGAGDFGSGTSTNDTAPVLKGTVTGLMAGDVVQILEGSVLLGTAVVTGTTWTFALSTLANGSSHTYRAVIADMAGNKGTASADFSLTVITTLPPQSVAVVSFTDDQDPRAGTFASGGATNDTSPQLNGTFGGTLGAGDVVAVFRDGVRLGEATITGGSSWTFQDAGLADGKTYNYTACVEDAAGNRGGASAAFTLTVDQTAPSTAPLIDGFMDDVGPVTGPIASGSTTNDARPELNGTGAEPDGIVRIYDNGTLIGSTTADATGKWSFTPEAGKEFVDGDHSLTTSSVDAAGNEGPRSARRDFKVDTVAPSQSTTIVSVNDDQGSLRGKVTDGGYTDDVAPQVAGEISAALKAGEKVVVLRDGAVLGTATMTDATHWTFDDAGLGDGRTYSYTARVEDAAGNRGAISGSHTVTVDTSVPKQAATISTVFDNTDPVQGDVANGGITNDSQPELRGTVSGSLGGNEVVAVYRDDVRIGTASVSGTSWSYTDTSGLANASRYSYTVRVEDAAGNAGATSLPYDIGLLIDGPVKMTTITAVIDDVDPQRNTVANSGYTNDTAPRVTGTISAAIMPGEKVAVLRDGKQIGFATMTDATSWTYDDSALANGGTYVYTARVQDAAANPGAESNAYTIRVDTSAPTQTVTLVRATDDADPVPGDIPADGSTNDDTPTLEGAVSAPLSGTERLEVFRNGAHAGTATVTGTTWTFQDASLSSGTTYTYEARVMDAAGNAGAASNSLRFTVNTSQVSQTVQILQVQDHTDPATSNVPNGGTTNETRPALSGSISTALNASDVVQVLRDDKVIGTATVTGTTWRFRDTGLADGKTYSYAARVVNSGGNEGAKSAAYAITVDLAAPTQTVTITSITDDQDPQQASLASGSTTNDTTPQLNGTLSDPLGAGEVVVIHRGSTRLGTATMTSATTWVFNDAGLADGASYRYFANVEDAAGNEGRASADFRLTVDRTAPPAAPSIDSITDNVDPIQSPIVSGGPTNDTRPELKGSGAEPNGIVKVYDNGVLIGSATADAAGKWAFTPPAGQELVDGLHELRTSNVDAAGNEGPKSTALTITVDTIAPKQLATIVAISDDTGLSGTDFITGDTTLVVTATVDAAVGAGETVQISLDNGATWRDATFVSGRTYRLDNTGASLAPGDHTFQARVIDAAGNIGSPTSQRVVIDTQRSTGIAIDIASISTDSGTPGDFITSDTSLTIGGKLTGTLAADEVAQISIDGGTTWSNLTVTGGNWSYVDGRVLAEGRHDYRVRVVDTAGNLAASDARTVVIDLAAPTAGNAVAITAYADDIDPNAGDYASGTSTNDTTPTLKGTVSGLKAGDVVQILEGSVLLGTATVNGGAWEFRLSALADGSTHTYTAVIANAAGNKGTTSADFTLTVDATPPSAPPVIDRIMDNVDPVQGPIDSDGSTNDARPELKGSGAEPGGTVNIYDNGTLIGSVKADGAGKWSFEPALGKELANGVHSLRVSNVDAAGNEGPQSAARVFTVDTVAPPQIVTLARAIDDIDPVRGNIAANGSTNDESPKLEGTLSAALGSTEQLRVFRNGVHVGNATVTGTDWSFDDSGLSSGTTYTYEARVMDTAGNAGAASNSLRFTVNTSGVAQTAQILRVQDNVDPVPGAVTNGGTTDDIEPVLSGSISASLNAGDVLQVLRNDTVIGTAIVSGTTWRFRDKGLADGMTYRYTVRVVNSGGNEGAESAAHAITVDLTAPAQTVTIASYTDDRDPKQGDFASGSTTNDATPELKGTLSGPLGAGEVVAIYRDGVRLAGAAVVNGTAWTFDDRGLADGTTYRYTARVEDAAGHQGAVSAIFTLTVDRTAPPTAPSIDSVEDDVTPVAGPVVSRGTTNDARPELKGSGAESGGTVNIYDNGTLIGSATADAAGMWTYTPPAGRELADGLHRLTTRNVDAAGNESQPSAAAVFTVDTVAPANAPSIERALDDVAPVTSAIVADGKTNDARPELRGTGTEPNGLVNIYDNDTLIGSTTADGVGRWSFTPGPGKELADGPHKLTASNVDAAGNEGPRSTALAFVVDTVPPPVATLGLGNYSDSAPAAGTLAANQASDRNSSDNSFDLVLTGGDASGASYEVSTNGGQSWKATTAAQNNLSDGKYLFRASLTDEAGNSTAAANTIEVTVDRTGPGLALQRVGGALVAGTTEAGALVAIDVGNNGSVEASVTADANGNWSWTSSTPIAASTVVSAVAYDLAGNASSKSTQVADTTPPVISIDKSDGNRFSGKTSDADTPMASPTATKPITVTLSVDRNADGTTDYVLPFTATVTADGTWSIDASSAPVNVGAIVTAVAQDYSGNRSAPATVTVGGGTSRISGSASNDNFGYDVQAIGDFNGDGYNDFAVVAPHGSSAARAANAWSVNILYGSKQGLPDLSNVANLPGTDGLKIFTSGDISDSNILTAVQGYGDVNGDGYSDVIVYDDNLNSDWVIFGRSSANATSAPVNVDVRTIVSSGGNSDGVAIVQREGSTWFGAGGALVDVNGDGYADIVMQDWNQGTGDAGTAIIYGHAGAAGSAAWANYYVGFTGGSSPSSYVSDSRNSSTESYRPHSVIYNDNTNHRPNNVLNIGDINGDGYSDFAYSLFEARNPVGNIGNAGAIQVIYGSAKGFTQDYSLQTDYTNIANGFRVYGEQANQFLGTFIDPEPYGYLSNTGMPTSSGDVNGDGIADLIIGSPQFGPDAGEQKGPGRVYVVYGKAGGAASNVNLANLSPADGFVITASDSTPDAMFGNGTSVGDFNGDGIDDIAIGAPLADVKGMVNNGAVYIVYGQQGGYSGTMSVAATYWGEQSANSMNVTYAQNGNASSGSMLGVNVALSDLNGDGQADLALGSAYRSLPWAPAAGYLDVVYSSAFNFTNPLTVGDDVIAATAGKDRLSGGAGNDVITDVRAGDSAYGGAGNDTIRIGEIAGVVRVDGGLGIDTLAVDASNLTLDMSQLGLRVQGFENFDMGSGAGNTGNILRLRLSDVLNQQSSMGSGNGGGQGHLRVTGDGGDTVQLLQGAGSWSSTGTTSVAGVTYDIYHNSALPATNTHGDVWVQQGVRVALNSSGASNASTLNQTAAITNYTDNENLQQGDFASGSTTDDTTPQLNGTLSGALGSGEMVAVYRDDIRIGSATMTGPTTWNFKDASLVDGVTYSYTARVEDGSGNRGAVSAIFTLTVDLTPPTTPLSIDGVVDDVGPVKATLASGATTDDANPVLTGKLTAALGSGEVVRIYEGTTLLGTATVNGTAWTYDLGNLADGSTHTYRAVVADIAGGEGPASGNFSLTVDYALAVNRQTTVDTTPIVSGTIPFKLVNGQYIEVTIAGKTYSSANGAVVVDSQNNTWYVQVSPAIAVGTYDVQAVIKSAVGVKVANDDTTGELIVSAAPTVTVGSAASDPNQKATAYTLGENGMWRIHSNQTMLDANGTNSGSLGSFSQKSLYSNSNDPANPGYAAGYLGRNYVQNATFLDFNRDGYMDLFAEDSTYEDGQQAFIFNGSRYDALQVGAPYEMRGDKSTAGSANTFSWYGGVVAFDKTGDGLVDIAYGDQTPDDSVSGGGHDSQIVLNENGSILGMVKDGGYTDDQVGPALGQGSLPSQNSGNSTFNMELSGVDLNNDGKVDLVYHANIGITKIGGPSDSLANASTPRSGNAYRLVVATNKGDGTWENTQIIENTFQRVDSPSYGNGISMTWADFNGDGYMDLFMGRGYATTIDAQYQSRIIFNDGAGKLKMGYGSGDSRIGSQPSDMYLFDDADYGWRGTVLEKSWLQGGPSLAVDWNGDGRMDAIELPGFALAGGMTASGNTGPINLYTNNSSAAKVDFSKTNLLGGSNTIGQWTGDLLTNNAVTGAVAADIDWDGDKDLLAFTQRGSTKFITNTSTVADGTSLHFRILDAQGINALYGNTVQLFDSKGKLVGTQIINPQSGNQTNDSSAIVDFYGLDAKETYTLALLRIENGRAADVGGMGTLGGNTIENVNAAWTGLKTGEANHAFVLTAESDASAANANIGNGIVGTGYNDTFFATLGNDRFEGGGGAVTVSGVRAWSNTGGLDVVDYKLAGGTSLTIDLGNTGAQNTGFGTATFRNIEGLAGGSGADTFTDNAADNQFEGRGGNDVFNLTGGGRDTLLYKLLASSDATGGNGADSVNGFTLGTFEATPDADRIDLRELLMGYRADGDGAARYINGVATIDAGETIGEYLSVSVSGGNTMLSIDRDGSGSAYAATPLIMLNGVTADLATLLANHQLVLA